jgi:hypothetical protein
MEHTHDILRNLIKATTCKPKWWFALNDSDTEGLRLVITVAGPDSTQPIESIRVAHFFPVPTATYNLKTWRRWVFECCQKVELHELDEWFKIDGVRPFPPLHGPGEDPYTLHEFRDEIDARTVQSGEIVESLI